MDSCVFWLLMYRCIFALDVLSCDVNVWVHNVVWYGWAELIVRDVIASQYGSCIACGIWTVIFAIAFHWLFWDVVVTTYVPLLMYVWRVELVYATVPSPKSRIILSLWPQIVGTNPCVNHAQAHCADVHSVRLWFLLFLGVDDCCKFHCGVDPVEVFGSWFDQSGFVWGFVFVFPVFCTGCCGCWLGVSCWEKSVGSVVSSYNSTTTTHPSSTIPTGFSCPSLSISLSHTSPIPSLSRSFWDGL